MTPEQMRRVMPMTKYWAIQQGLKKGTQSFFEPWTFLFDLIAKTTKAAADTLQHAVFHKEAKCTKPTAE